MWNKGVRWLLVIQLQFGGKRKIFIPLPLIFLYEILDELDSLISIIKFLRIPIKIEVSSNVKIYGANILNTLLTILNGIKYMEPVDLVNVDTNEVKVKIRIL